MACSGGKDSTVLLHVLHKLGYDVTAVAVDEGIHPYRDENLAFLRAYCTRAGVPLRVLTFKEAYGEDLDDAHGARPCSVCGVQRRRLLEQAAAGFDAVATGHNADDEAQTVLMNLTRAHTDQLFRTGPSTSSAEGFVKRVKPLYFLTEKHILVYALLHGLATEWNECPYAPQALRNDYREALNTYAERHPGAKQRLLNHHLAVRERARKKSSPAEENFKKQGL